MNIVINVILLIITLITWIMMIIAGKMSMASSKYNMTSLLAGRSQSLMATISSYENILYQYSLSDQVRQAVISPNDKMTLKAAQKFTDQLAGTMPGTESLYISTWDTKCIVHSNPDYIGSRTKEEESELDELHTKMIAGNNGLYDAGFIVSPVSGKLILSLYQTLYDDNDQPVGIAGLGIQSESFMSNFAMTGMHHVEHFAFDLIDCNTKTYIFSPSHNTGDTISQPEIADAVNSAKESPDGIFKYKTNEGKQIVAYKYIPAYNMVLTLIIPQSELYYLPIQMRLFMILFAILVIGVGIAIDITNKKHEALRLDMNAQILQNNKAKNALNNAIFNDILTNVGNRTAFSMDMEKMKLGNGDTCMFGMLSIDGLSDINSIYGNNTGDVMLLALADMCQEEFPEGKVYRTGSSEFIIALRSINSTAALQDFASRMVHLTAKANVPQATSNNLPIPCKASVCKKSSDLNTAIVTIMKAMIKQPGRNGQMQIIDLDNA